jgi:uncharacterized sodium:solute symporter family permease YidK
MDITPGQDVNMKSFGVIFMSIGVFLTLAGIGVLAKDGMGDINILYILIGLFVGCIGYMFEFIRTHHTKTIRKKKKKHPLHKYE